MVATDDWVKNRDHLLPAMNMGCISLEWGKIESDSGHVNYDLFDEQIEWAHANQLRVFAGPLISLQPHTMPNWLYLLSDFDALLKAACEFTERTVKRYQGRIHLWCAAAGLNGPNDLKLTDEQILRLAVGVIQTVRRTDSRTPVVLALDMPWAEYLGQKEDAISPIHFADALIRADLGLSGLALEMNLDYWPGGSLPRDLIDISDLIDTWSMLGLPLMAILSTPNSLQKDPRVNSRYGLVSHWKHPELPLSPASDKCAGMPPNGLDIIQLLLAKPNIHGIIWNQPSDAIAHAFPNSGLFGPDGQPRPILDAIGRLRQQHIH